MVYRSRLKNSRNNDNQRNYAIDLNNNRFSCKKNKDENR